VHHHDLSYLKNIINDIESMYSTETILLNIRNLNSMASLNQVYKSWMFSEHFPLVINLISQYIYLFISDFEVKLNLKHFNECHKGIIFLEEN